MGIFMVPNGRAAVSRCVRIASSRFCTASHDAAQRGYRAAAFERAIPAGIGPIAMQLLPVFLARKTVCKFLAGRTAIDIFLGQIHEIVLAEAAFRFRAGGHRLGQPASLSPLSHWRDQRAGLVR
jgi:hypothetical protein